MYMYIIEKIVKNDSIKSNLFYRDSNKKIYLFSVRNNIISYFNPSKRHNKLNRQYCDFISRSHVL